MAKPAILSIRIISDAKKAKKGFDETASAADKFASKLKGLAAGALAGVGIAKITKDLFDLGNAFNETWKAVRVGTGATGADLEGLKQSVRNVAAAVPDMNGGIENTGNIVADLNTRLGLTGPVLDTVASQFVTLGNLGVDADINAVSAALNSFGIEAEQIPTQLDKLFQVSQATGLTITELTSSAAKAGPGLKAFGYDLSDSAALVGMLDKAGVNADGTLNRLQRALSEFAKQGRDAPEALQETIASIDEFIKKGDDAAAIDMATKLFGTRGAAQFVDAVKQGVMSVEDFAKAAGTTEDTILGVGEEVMALPEKFQLLKQNIQLALEPVASMVFDALEGPITTAADVIGGLAPVFQALGAAIQENLGWIAPLAAAVGAAAAVWAVWTGAIVAWTGVTKIAAATQALLNAIMAANPIMLVVMAVAALTAALIVAYNRSETFRNAVQAAGNIGRAAFTFLGGGVKFVIQLIGNLISRAGGIGGAFRSAMSIARGAVSLLTAPLRGLISLISSVIGWISRIRFPSPPAWMTKIMGHAPAADVMGVPGGDAVMRFVAPPTITAAGTPEITAARPSSSLAGLSRMTASPGRVTVDNSVNITVDGSGVVDPRAVAAQIKDVLRTDARTRGLISSGARSWQ